MATRILGPTGSKRRRRFLIVPILLIAGLALFWIGSASPSVHDIAVFQLDGNATVADTGPLGYPGDDWDNICTTAAPNAKAGCNPGTGDTAHRVGSAFDYDQHPAGPAGSGVASCPKTNPTVYAPGNNCTTFTGGGSKDDGDINGWAWNDGSGGLPDKDNLEQGYSARYTYSTTLTTAVPASTPCDPTAPTTIQIDNTVASWFSMAQQNFQFNNNKDYHLTIGNETMLVTGGQNTNTLNVLRCQQGSTDGAHAVGDVVTVSLLYFGATRFDNSGDAQIGVWFFQNNVGLGTNKIGGGTGFSGVHKDGDILILSTFTGGGETPTIQVWKWVAGQGNNGNTNLQLLSPQAGASCIPVAGTSIVEVSTTSPFCAAVNPADGVASPWTFTNKRGRSTFDAAEFYEGGLNISAFPQLASECFGSFEIETRSSQSTSAVLKDFLLGPLQSCTPGVTTDPQNGSNTSVSGSDVPPGTTVHDVATITGRRGDGSLGPNPTGTVNFTLCGPFTTQPTTAPVCATETDNAGTNKPLTASNPATANSNDVNTAASPLATGWWCFRADYSGDSNYSPASGSDTTECFHVVTIPTSIKSKQSWYPNDTATVTASSGNLGASGTIVFQFFASTDCTGTVLYQETQTVTGGATSEEHSTSNPGGGDTTGGLPASLALTTGYADAAGSTKVGSWKIVYTPNASDLAHTGSQSACTTGHSENFTTTYTNDAG
jgi:hypothetical protein